MSLRVRPEGEAALPQILVSSFFHVTWTHTVLPGNAPVMCPGVSLPWFRKCTRPILQWGVGTEAYGDSCDWNGLTNFMLVIASPATTASALRMQRAHKS